MNNILFVDLSLSDFASTIAYLYHVDGMQRGCMSNRDQ